MKRSLALLVAAPLVALAFAAAPNGQLTVVEPAEAAVMVDSPTTICNRWRPHGSSDTVYTAKYYALTTAYVKTQCVAAHTGAQGTHYYCVDTWWNGVESWNHPCYAGL